MNNTFIDNKDGTVTDLTTGLMWQQEAPTNEMYWEGAIEYCENLDLAGHKDWRLPTVKELFSLINLDKYDPAINTDYFPDTKSSYYWSSTTNANYTGNAWHVGFYYGYVNYRNKSVAYSVRVVRVWHPSSQIN